MDYSQLIYKSIIYGYNLDVVKVGSGRWRGAGARRGNVVAAELQALVPIKFQTILIQSQVTMNQDREQGEEEKKSGTQDNNPKLSSEEEEGSGENPSNRHLAFQKNYPKNIFIPMIEHLSERGLQREYEGCVGTREGFQGKNVVSLAEIHRVMSQEWFSEGINLVALVSSMSNKILMNSKIKKKLFHLLLIRHLFAIPLQDPRQFKKQVSRRANEVADSKLPDDPLFAFPSALIYLLHIFAQALNAYHPQQDRDISLKRGETSSKLEYKYYISKIIIALNNFQGDHLGFLDLMESVKLSVQERQWQIREKYSLPDFVPEWSYFSSIVVSNCCTTKRNRQRLTYSLLNTWIQEFKERATSLKGFIDILALQTKEPEPHRFTPIVLISPP